MRDFSDLANVQGMAQSFADERQEECVIYRRAALRQATQSPERFDFEPLTMYLREHKVPGWMAEDYTCPCGIYVHPSRRTTVAPDLSHTVDCPHFTLLVRPRYRYLDDIKRRNAKIGNHWFEPDTMRFFSSRVHSSIYAHGKVAYFVTSEKPPHARRAYSVRRANADGSIDTVGEFCGFSTGRAAHARAAYIAEHGEEA